MKPPPTSEFRLSASNKTSPVIRDVFRGGALMLLESALTDPAERAAQTEGRRTAGAQLVHKMCPRQRSLVTFRTR